MYTLKKNNTSLLCIVCLLMPQVIPLLTLTLGQMWYEESTPWATMTLKKADWYLSIFGQTTCPKK